ncbi:hypothetical protein J5N97_007596 [Dioscorea zingiberensis]|uniref:CN hydrolase domain-containing protein n=1 Tax=Dioscorea zingiberensis TaxID=325984 RepID=A0A9D5DCQ2_9LILI|nr:hypothetical protein J5N97_007596 [Dioscorea zingiberensis]
MFFAWIMTALSTSVYFSSNIRNSRLGMLWLIVAIDRVDGALRVRVWIFVMGYTVIEALDEGENIRGKKEIKLLSRIALQFACSDSVSENVDTAERLVRAVHGKGVSIILIQELFEGFYFCQAQSGDFFNHTKPYKGHPTISRKRINPSTILKAFFQYFKWIRMQKQANELGVVMPVIKKSFISIQVTLVSSIYQQFAGINGL